MNRMTLGCVVGILSATVTMAADTAPLDGAWTIQSVIRDGKVDDNYTGATRVFEGGRYTMKAAEGKTLSTTTGTFAVDTVTKTIDMKPVDGRYKGHTLLGVYSLDGGTLRIAFAEPGTDRPTQYESRPGNGVVVAVMKRARE